MKQVNRVVAGSIRFDRRRCYDLFTEVERGDRPCLNEETYLRSSFEPDAEFIDDQVLARPTGQYDHADWQQAIQRWFAENARAWNIRAVPELRVRVRPGNYRIPDVAVLDRSHAKEQVATVPLIAVFEVLSPEDTMQRLYGRLEDFARMGIPQVWVVDPETAEFRRYLNGNLLLERRFEATAQGISFELAQIATLLQD